jgi:hypothetical protein
MSTKRHIDKAVDNLVEGTKDAARDVRDATTEAVHRSNAEAERANREVNGDQMTLGEKVASGGREAKERLAAETDKMKREVRDHT